MTIYYHVSTNLQHSGVFEPRVPGARHRTREDDTTPRICVAPSIDGCFTAIPGGGSDLEELVEEERGYFLVFKIDTEKLGINNSDIVYSDTLYEKDFVRDAEESNEVWITTPFTVPEEDKELIQLTSWREEIFDVLPYSIYAIADSKYEGDSIAAYEDIYEERVPCGTKIVGVTYTSENAKKDEVISLLFETKSEAEAICFILQSRADIKNLKIGIDEIGFTLTKDANLFDLFMLHSGDTLVEIKKECMN